jgi:hypothetical protein
MSNRDGDYTVGYGKPPKGTRFKPGKSGNPKGRPRRKSLIDLLERELRGKVTIKEHGGQRRIRKDSAIIKQFVAKAASGDQRAIRLLFEMLEKCGGTKPQSFEIFITENEAKY